MITMQVKMWWKHYNMHCIKLHNIFVTNYNYNRILNAMAVIISLQPAIYF